MENIAAPPRSICGLTQEKVISLKDDVPLVGGKCQNIYEDADGNEHVCGRAVGSHPSELTASAAATASPTYRVLLVRLAVGFVLALLIGYFTQYLHGRTVKNIAQYFGPAYFTESYLLIVGTIFEGVALAAFIERAASSFQSMTRALRSTTYTVLGQRDND